MAERMPIPDRVSVDRGGYHQSDNFTQHLMVKLDGMEQKGVVREFSISGGWVRRVKLNEKGRPVTAANYESFEEEVVHGKVEVSWI